LEFLFPTFHIRIDLMQLSFYLKAYPYEERPGHLLLYSTKKTSMILLKKETFRAIENGGLSPSDEATLFKLGMIVPDQQEEKQAVFGLFDDLNARSTRLDIVVVLNLDCNFACTYCFEGDIKGNLYMSDETAESLVDFVKEKFTKDKKSLVVDFYGGEPLLSIMLIKSISRKLKSFCENRGASYSFTLVTNGSLFKRRVAEELVPLGLRNVKITLDGPAETHNISRPFKSGAGSFDAIMANIKQTCDIVQIGIGGNYDRHNYKKFPLLLDCMAKEGLTPDKINMIRFDPVVNRPEGDTSPADYKGGCMSINEPWLLDADPLLRKEILKRGYNTPKPSPIFCMVERMDSYVVNFDGVLYKCPAFVGKKGFEAGNVRTGVKDYTSSYNLGIWKHKECTECEYLPLCFGGCRYMSLVKYGNMDKADCKKAFLDASLERSIKQHIKYRLKRD
jgi:uncharacterized protein